MLLAIIAGWWWRVLGSEWWDAPPTFDALAYYLPLAKKFLVDPHGLWLDPERIAVAPGSFIYFSLFGADPHHAYQGNLWLSTLSIVLLFDGARRLGSWWVGLAAAALYVASPVLPRTVIPLQTEGPYLFLLALWLWASIRIWTQPARWAFVVLGALAISAATLTRAIHLYWVPAAALCAGLGWWWARRIGHSRDQRFFLQFSMMHLLAVAPLLAYIAFNAQTLQTHKFVTGSGAAWYFGMNAAVGGEEPPYFNLIHAVQMAYRGQEGHLTPDADAQLAAVAKAIALDMPVRDLIELTQHKVVANLFYSHTHLRHKFGERFYRIVLIFFSLWALLSRWLQPFVQMMALLLCYHLAILSVLMYDQRYSIGSLELPLTLLAALGVVAFLGPQVNQRARVAGLSVLLLATLFGAWQLRSAPPPMPDLSKVPHTELSALDSGAATVSAVAGSLFGDGASALPGGVTLRWDVLDYQPIGATPILRVPLVEGAPACGALHLSYATGAGGVLTQAVALKRLTSPVELALGTSWLDSLGPPGGALTLHFDCPEGTRLRLGRLRLEAITLGPHYLDRIGMKAP